jgi:hypothetical protein
MLRLPPVRRMVQHAQAHDQVESVVGKRQVEDVGLHEVNAGQVSDVGLRRVDGIAVVEANIGAAVARDNFGKPAHPAACIENEFAAQLFQRKVEAGLQPVARVGAAGVAVKLGRGEALPFIAETARVGVLLDQAWHTAHDGKRVAMLAGQSAGVDVRRIGIRLQARLTYRAAQPFQEFSLHVYQRQSAQNGIAP